MGPAQNDIAASPSSAQDCPALVCGLGNVFNPVPNVIEDAHIKVLYDPLKAGGIPRKGMPNLVGYSDIQLRFQFETSSGYELFLTYLSEIQLGTQSPFLNVPPQAAVFPVA